MRRSHSGGYGYEPLPSTSTHNVMEDENERVTEELKDKIHALKSLSIDIGTEVKYQDKMLRGMVSWSAFLRHMYIILHVIPGFFTPSDSYLSDKDIQVKKTDSERYLLDKVIENFNLKDDDFERTSGSLSGSVARVLRLAKAGHNYYILYLFLFSIVIFFVLWIVLKFK